jgi:ribonuclease HII
MSSIIGVDEAGRGPVLGPLVVAGFKLDSEEQEQYLIEIRVRDSKKCTRSRRERLAVDIRKLGKYSIKTYSAHEIDEYRKTNTLNRLEGELFAEVINTLSPDEDTTSFKKHIESNLIKNLNIISKHKADENHLVVAAASILAKTVRDFLIDEIGKELNAEIGSGYPADPITRNFLEKWIKEKGDLPPHTRLSWNTAKKLLNNHNKPVRTLDQFGDL